MHFNQPSILYQLLYLSIKLLTYSYGQLLSLFKEMIISYGLFDKIKCMIIILANIQVIPIKSCREFYEYSYHQFKKIVWTLMRNINPKFQIGCNFFFLYTKEWKKKTNIFDYLLVRKSIFFKNGDTQHWFCKAFDNNVFWYFLNIYTWR